MFKQVFTLKNRSMKLEAIALFVTALFLPANVSAIENASKDQSLTLALYAVAGICVVLSVIILYYIILVSNLRRSIKSINDKHSSEVYSRENDDDIGCREETAISTEDAVAFKETGWQIQYSTVDMLTKLPNRKHLVSYLRKVTDNSPEGFDRYALFIINLDFFRSVNNNLGHEAGDEIIIECAERFKHIFPDLSLIARMDGDEFAVVLNIFSTADIEAAADSILEAVKKPVVIQGQQIYISVSIGIAVFSDQSSNADELVKNAATAMNIVKNSTRNSYKIYSAEIAKYNQQKFIIHSELRHALENNEFVLHYQPKMHGKTLKLVGIEALIRWNHPERGLLYPLDFIPFAEESGLIKYIDEWVLLTACTQLKSWLDEGVHDIRLAVNLSAWQFKNVHLVDTVAKVLEETGVSPSYLELEITETTALENLNFAQSTLSKLMEMGINISIDDFGTGYSSFNYLKHFPISFLKIDKSFVADILSDKNTYSIVRAIIEVAHALDLKVVAEGVENQEQLEMLKDLSCDEIQGYLISKPLPVDGIRKHMQDSVI